MPHLQKRKANSMSRWNDPTTVLPTERRCTATNRAGTQCGKYAIKGGTVCTAHGGRTPNVQRRAQQNLALQEAEANATATLAHIGLRPITDPIVELSKVAGEILAFKDALAQRVNALQDPAYSLLGQERLRAEVELYERAMDRTVRVLDALGKHDLETRRVQVEEQTAAMFSFIIHGVLSDLNLDDAQQARSMATVETWVRKALEGVPAHDLPKAH